MLYLLRCCAVLCCPTRSYDQLREMTNSNTVVVLPAFETAPQKNMTLAHQLADTAALMNKAQLGRLVQKKLIYQFALYLFRQVRGCGQLAMSAVACCWWAAAALYGRLGRQLQMRSRCQRLQHSQLCHICAPIRESSSHV